MVEASTATPHRQRWDAPPSPPARAIPALMGGGAAHGTGTGPRRRHRRRTLEHVILAVTILVVIFGIVAWHQPPGGY